MDRPRLAAPAVKGSFVCPDSEVLERWPLLAAGCCDLWWSDGKGREPWTIAFTFSPDSVSLRVTDKDSKLVAFTTSTGFFDALDAFELALSGGSVAWRKSKY